MAEKCFGEAVKSLACAHGITTPVFGKKLIDFAIAMFNNIPGRVSISGIVEVLKIAKNLSEMKGTEKFACECVIEGDLSHEIEKSIQEITQSEEKKFDEEIESKKFCSQPVSSVPPSVCFFVICFFVLHTQISHSSQKS